MDVTVAGRVLVATAALDTREGKARIKAFTLARLLADRTEAVMICWAVALSPPSNAAKLVLMASN